MLVLMLGALMVLLNIGVVHAGAFDSGNWVSNSTIVAGLGSVSGGWSAPNVFDDAGTWKLIAGEHDGAFNGFYWSGSTWVSDSSIVNGLVDVGYKSTLTIFNDAGTWKLIAGESGGTFIGYEWNGTSWVSNSSLINGLGNVGAASAPNVFDDAGTWKLIAGVQTGVFYGFEWNGTSWVSNSSIVIGLGDVGTYSAPTVYNDSGTWKLISGNSAGVFTGFYWSGAAWVSDSSIVTGLSSVGMVSTPTVFNDSGIWKLISGEGNGVFNGYQWNNAPTIPTDFTDLGTHLTDHTPTITWTKGTDGDGDTVTTYVYAGTTSTPTTEEGNTTGETLDLGSIVTLSDGNTYYYRLRSYDGDEYSNYTDADEFRMNSKPSISNVTITPTVPLTTDNLIVNNDTATDPDGDGVILYYRWYKNNILQPALNGVINILSGNTSIGEVWKLGIIPNDGYENGTEVFSVAVTILETLYPSDVNVSVNGTRIYDGTGTLSTSDNIPDFSEKINNYLSNCTVDEDGYCDVPLEFEFANAGNLSVSGLSVAYTDGGTKVHALISSEGLKDTTLKHAWVATTTGDVCMLNSAEVPLEIGDMYFAENDSCAFTCDTFAAVRATTTCGSSAEFKGTPNGC